MNISKSGQAEQKNIPKDDAAKDYVTKSLVNCIRGMSSVSSS